MTHDGKPYDAPEPSEPPKKPTVRVVCESKADRALARDFQRVQARKAHLTRELSSVLKHENVLVVKMLSRGMILDEATGDIVQELPEVTR